ncbi:MAG: Gfo/Idh/MocA family oxidoreductase [Planctomycetes bacterium]|nr:Gfo/Idh/MocA family oxidoreductase [Planctomycetota bacterium]
MHRLNRREFLDRSKKTALGAAAAVTILADARSVRAAPANETIRLASVGVRGRGNSLAQGFMARDDCRITYVCDVSTTTGNSRAAQFGQQQGNQPKYVQDFRKALDDDSVDAIVVATPDHWHSLAAIWGCQAGKDVYVEKPPSQNCWEGRKMVEAARKYERIVQVGTQNRSAPYNLAAKKYITEGKLGKIHLCRVYNQKGNYGNFSAIRYTDPPADLDWDMWNGPAPESKYSPELHHHWHAWWRYSGGDIANDGVHQLDLARWLCGVEYPGSVYCTGGSFASEGIRDVPDTQVAVYDFDRMVMTFELTLYGNYMLKTDGGIRMADMYPHWPQNSTRIEIFGTEGVMFMGRHGGGWQVFTRPKDRKPVVKAEMYGRFPDDVHKENFCQCIRSRQLPNADVEHGQRSALLVHYANDSYRSGGQKLGIDPKTEQYIDNPQAMALWKRAGRDPWIIPENV